MENDFTFLNKIHHNSSINQLKNVAEHSNAKCARYVFDDKKALHCADAVNFIHSDVHSGYYEGKTTAAGQVYHDSTTGKHYYEINDDLRNDKDGSAGKRFERHGIEKMPAGYDHKEKSNIVW